MIFSEIALEGVRCFHGQCRIGLKQGYNLVYGPNESGKSTVLECIEVLLDPARQISENEAFPTWGPPGNSRAGLVISEGGQTYRVTRDFVNGMVSLGKLNPNTKKFDIIAQDHAQANSILRQQLKLPSIDIYRKLFVIDKEDIPSGRPKVIVQQIAAPAANPAGGASGAMPGSMPGQMPMQAAPPPGYGLPPEEIKSRIDQLKQQLEQVNKTGKIQYEIDGLEAKLFDIENKTKEIKAMENKAEQIESSLKSLKSLLELPPDIIKRIEFFEESQREHNHRVNEIDNRLGASKMKYGALHNRMPFFKERNFIIGAVCVIGGILVNIMAPEDMPILKPLPPLAIIAGLGLIFWVLWNEFSSRTNETEAHGVLKKAEEERHEEEKKFEVEGSVIKRLMSDAGVDNVSDLHQKLKEFQKRRQTIEELNVKIEKLKKESNYSQLTRDKKEFEERVQLLSRELQASGGGGFTQDPADIQRQLDSLLYALNNPNSPPPASAAPAPMPMQGAMPYGAGAPLPPMPDMTMPSGGSMLPPPPMTPAMPMPGPSTGGAAGGDYLGGGDDYLSGGADYNTGSQGQQPQVFNPDQTVASAGQKTASSSSGGGGGIDTMVDELWAAAEQLTGMNRSTIIMQVGERFKVYINAFTGKKYNDGDLSSEKNLSLRSATGSYVDLKDLSPSTQDAAWLALKIALMENLSKQFNLPVLLDDPLRNLDDSRLAMVSKALKRIGAAGQVVLLSTQRAHSKICDTTVSLVPEQA